MFKAFILLIVGILFFTGCASHEYITLSKLKKSNWYKSESILANQTKGNDLHFAAGYIFAGQVRETRYNYYQKTISDVILSPSHCLLAPSYWDEWFDTDPIQFGASNDNFKNGYFPTVGEYWAFRVAKGPKGNYKIISAVKLFSDSDSDVSK